MFMLSLSNIIILFANFFEMFDKNEFIHYYALRESSLGSFITDNIAANSRNFSKVF